MFSLTARATTALASARDAHGAPDTYGIRFFAPVPGLAGLTFDFVAAPRPGDVIGGPSHLRTFVDAEVDRRIGDATIDFETVDGKSGIVIRPYPAGRARR